MPRGELSAEKVFDDFAALDKRERERFETMMYGAKRAIEGKAEEATPKTRKPRANAAAASASE
ncbi:MAG: hypothetical protein KGL39_51655 [Patescibacteria group bacterium]|nr:hypothetical protein [Patescibacteria group bacterium]